MADEQPAACLGEGHRELVVTPEAVRRALRHGSHQGIALAQPLVAGQHYYLVVGSFNAGEPVTATITVDGPEQPPSNPADLNGDGHVDAQDITILLSSWGQPGVADLDGSGAVGSADITIMLNFWG